MTVYGCCFELTAETRIAVEPDQDEVGESLARQLRPATGFPFEVTTGWAENGDIDLRVGSSVDRGDQGYLLDSNGRQLTMIADDPKGLFYAGQTLLQLLPPEIHSTETVDMPWLVPKVHIEDQPRFSYRGVMVDVARHFYGPETLERLIDRMALYKLNRLHLHLTDDQGWRIEIKSWPKLTEIGGATQVGGGEGGFYTQDEFAALIAYAKDRWVVIIPEVDMPSHVNAALASYPELNSDGVAAEPFTGVGVGISALDPDLDVTTEFMGDVYWELATITAGPWIHVGGDEAAAIDDEAYGELMRHGQEVIDPRKVVIGWEEVGRADLPYDYVAQAWLYGQEAEDAAAQGAQIIASPADHAYLDMLYDVDTPVGTFWAGATPVQDAYEWDPVAPFTEDQILGVEGALWTETVETEADLDLLIWPRTIGHAEIGWSAAEGRSWDEYRVRLGTHGTRLDTLGVGFYRSDAVDWQ